MPKTPIEAWPPFPVPLVFVPWAWLPWFWLTQPPQGLAVPSAPSGTTNADEAEGGAGGDEYDDIP